MVTPQTDQAQTALANGERDYLALVQPNFVIRHLQRIVLALVSLVMCVLLISSGFALKDLVLRQFQSEAHGIGTNAKFEVNKAIIRVKDAANFINSDAAIMVAAKVSGSVRKSSYITDIGYIQASDAQSVWLLRGGGGKQGEAAQAQLKKLMDRLEPKRGSVVALNAADYPALVGTRPHASLLLIQAQPFSTPSEKLIYATLDFDALCKAMVGPSSFQNVYRFRATGSGINMECSAKRRDDFLQTGLFHKVVKEQVALTKEVNFAYESEAIFPFAEKFAFLVVFAFVAIACVALASRITTKNQRLAADQLMTAVEAARASSAAKDEFLANMSHEIRTPLNGVLGMAQVLRRTELDGSQQRYVRQIQSSSQALLAILNDVLDLSKIDQGKMSIDPIRTNLHQLSQDVLMLYSAVASEKQVSLLIDIDTAVPRMAFLDPTRLRQIIGNLVSNAVKFTENGEILVQMRALPRGYETQLLLTVSDTGIGISEENQQKLFERFVQAEAGTARRYGGTGLGLSIVRQLVDLMGGSITLTSTLGEGTSFHVELPIEPIAEEQGTAQSASIVIALITSSPFVTQIIARVLADCGIGLRCFSSATKLMEGSQAQSLPIFAGVIIDEAHDVHDAWEGWQSLQKSSLMLGDAWSVLLADQPAHIRYMQFTKTLTKPFMPGDLKGVIASLSRSQNAAPTSLAAEQAPMLPETAPRFDGRQCLVVDDNAINRLVITELLEPYHFQIDTASDGQKAVNAAKAKRYDVIFMDCRMPNVDGYEATAQLRALMAAGDVAHAPIIALTANAMKGDREACLDAGMDAFLSKPVQMPELVDILLTCVPRSDIDCNNGEIDWLETATPAQPTPLPPEPVAPAASPTPPPPPPPPVAAQNEAQMPAQAIAELTMVANSGWALAAPVFQAKAPQPPAMPAPPEPTAITPPAAQHQPAPPQKAEILDTEAFQQLKTTMRSFGSMIELYRHDTRDYLQNIAEAITIGDMNAALLPAHTIKSSSKIIGATAMADLANSMEASLRNGVAVSPDAWRAQLDMLNTTFAQTLAAIDAQQNLAA